MDIIINNKSEVILYWDITENEYWYILNWKIYSKIIWKLIEWVSLPLDIDNNFYLYTNKFEVNTYLIEKEFQDTMKLITSNYSNEEREGWNSQLEWAKLVLAWETSPLLEAIVAETWEDINVLAQSIVDKANLYEVEYAKALWIKRAKLSAL